MSLKLHIIKFHLSFYCIVMVEKKTGGPFVDRAGTVIKIGGATHSDIAA